MKNGSENKIIKKWREPLHFDIQSFSLFPLSTAILYLSKNTHDKSISRFFVADLSRFRRIFIFSPSPLPLLLLIWKFHFFFLIFPLIPLLFPSFSPLFYPHPLSASSVLDWFIFYRKTLLRCNTEEKRREKEGRSTKMMIVKWHLSWQCIPEKKERSNSHFLSFSV